LEPVYQKDLFTGEYTAWKALAIEGFATAKLPSVIDDPKKKKPKAKTFHVEQ
jgi:hypothetical protein